MKKLLLITMSAGLFIAPIVYGFSMPWAHTDDQARYNMAEENYQQVLGDVQRAYLQKMTAQADLAFTKAEKASQAHNMEELQRLTDVVNRINIEMEEIKTGRLVFRWTRN